MYRKVVEFMSSQVSSPSFHSHSVIRIFFRYVIPSILSLLAISTASLIDGFFIGNYVGTEALAAINLLMPFFSLLFGIALMLAVGGAIKAGLYIGAKEYRLASEIFSKTLMAVFIITACTVPIALFFAQPLFLILGADPELIPWMNEYFNVIIYSTVVQLCGLVLYYFLRADDYPELGMHALLLGAVVNIILDSVFVYYFNWGLQGAAWATFIAQSMQILLLARYFFMKEHRLNIVWPKTSWLELLHTAYNGFSEFVNEFSIGVVILVLHWIVNTQSGVEGIAAFSVINYLIFVSLMTYYGIVDAMHAILAPNIGARRFSRVFDFMCLAGFSISILSLLFLSSIFIFRINIVEFFLKDEAVVVADLVSEFIFLIWPIFIFNGFNVLICAYLTCAQKPLHSTVIALLRSLFLPIILALIIYYFFKGNTYLYALPLAEMLTFSVAVFFIYRYRPSEIKKAII
ncbi:MATE family efflux transporter [Marinagarivorans algicola]|uniref:MATE family efflux transporter n=1 Tax=Marinagarivorans algicola TaxID=1513270 RepID=UPI0006B58017